MNTIANNLNTAIFIYSGQIITQDFENILFVIRYALFYFKIILVRLKKK